LHSKQPTPSTAARSDPKQETKSPVAQEEIMNSIIHNFKELDAEAQKKLLKMFLQENSSESIDALAKVSPVLQKSFKKEFKKIIDDNSIEVQYEELDMMSKLEEEREQMNSGKKLSMDLSQIDKSITDKILIAESQGIDK